MPIKACFSPKAIISLAIFSQCLMTPNAFAQLMEEISVDGKKNIIAENVFNLSSALKNQGVNFYSAGGIAKLPVLRGMNDDRVKLLIDGAETTSACANHMNPALSYVNINQIETTRVIAGITPVSLGGDSIAGTISITSTPPAYAQKPGTVRTSGFVDGFFASNDVSRGFGFNGAIATQSVYLQYSGRTERAQSYYDGDGDKVLDTLYRSASHNLTLGFRGDTEQLIIKASHHDVPFQGFPNQYMDMTGNKSNSVNLNYSKDLDWGKLNSRLSWQDVAHTMGFFSAEKPGTMPMNTVSKEGGYSVKVELPLAPQQQLTLGHEYHRFTLDDRWPAVAGSMMMGPDEFININDGNRTRTAFFAEAKNQINPSWLLLAGIRYEHVVTDTGAVQPYNSNPAGMMPNLDAEAAENFNQQPHKQRDDNIDVTLLGRYQASQRFSAEFGYARKTRTPNLYERYSWGRNTMAMTMIGWFGDGNGYVGNIDLNPELAHTLGLTLQWYSEAEAAWDLSIAPYYSYIDDYIDADLLGTFHPRLAPEVTRSRLQFANHDAEIYGIDIEANYTLWENNLWGSGSVNGRVAYTRGKRTQAVEQDLYQIMPLNLSATINQSLKNWQNSLTVEWVGHKNHSNTLRHENPTPSYLLVNLSTRLNLDAWTLNASIDNIFNRHYLLPLGGVNIAQWYNDGMDTSLPQLAGKGRSINLGVRFAF